MECIVDDISDSTCMVTPIYYSKETSQDRQTFLFDFEVVYTKVPEPNSDGEADYMSNEVKTRTTNLLQRYGRDEFVGQDEEQIKATIYEILYEIGVPPYRGIMKTFAEEIKSLLNSPLEKLEKIKVKIEVVAHMFPEDEIDVEGF
ncbi:hypothetical protein ISN44_As08g016830 [Arabidopsis suecica]|uniref:Uncharacterized protein n=1 Tax=Arabidopsis suecica TaxID=45249 RepID=A0A8T2B911_ARASU|nr:hypothetical protein ISN44_As08g016830 [Arabidopsis suecica]